MDLTSGELLREIPRAHDSVVRDGIVYNVDNDPFREFRVEAVEAVSGKTLWETQLPADDLSLLQPPTVAARHVYVLGGSGIYALDVLTGNLDWTFDAVSHPPTVLAEIVYLMSELSAYAVDESTGKLVWSFETEGADMAGDEFPPVIADDVWLFAGGDGLYALDIATGSALWSFPSRYAVNPPQVADGTVLVASDGLTALEMASGDVMWRLPSTELSWPHAEDGVVYAVSLDGGLHFIDLGTGEAIGRVDIGYYHWRPPYAVHDGKVYVGYDFGDSSGVWAFTAERSS